MVLTDVLLISVIVSFVIDVSGAVDSLKRFLWRWLKTGEYREFSLKPIDCSLCSTFWIGLIYLFITKEFTLGYMVWVCICSFMADVWGDILWMIKDNVIKIIRRLNIFN